jgi:acetoin utilization protein AcuB
MMNEPLSSIMTKNVITADPNDKLSVARDIFKQNRVHHLPVVHGTTLLGILTTYDVFKLIDKSVDFDKTLIKDVMTTHVATLEPEDKIGSAAELFLENLFHAVPIVKDGELKGIVTSFDVIKYEFHKEYPSQDI